MTVIEIAKRNPNSNFHIWPTSFSGLVTEMAISPEKPREHVERIMMATTTTLLALFQTLVSILIVDFASLRIGESFISFRNLNELFLCLFITSKKYVRCGLALV